MYKLAGPNTLLLLSYEERTTGNKHEIERKFLKVSTGTNFFNTGAHFHLQLVRECFTVEEVPTSKLDPVYSSEDIHVLKLKKILHEVVVQNLNTQEFTNT